MNDKQQSGIAVGLTGGIACGKSEVGRLFREAGFPVIDTDQLAHEVMAPGGEAYGDLVDYFGEDVLDASGYIDRRKLGQRVFTDVEERHALNERVHPAVRKRWRRWMADKVNREPAAIVMIPLLFETGARRFLDRVICVSAPPEVVLERLGQRGLNDQEAQARILAQLPLEEKVRRADFVIENSGTLADLEQRVRGVADLILKEGVH